MPKQTLFSFVLLILFYSNVSHASKPRLALEQVDASRCRQTGQIDLYLAELELEGILRTPSQAQMRLVLDNQPRPGGPLKGSTFAKSTRKLQLILVLQLSGIVAEDLARIQKGIRDMVRSLPSERSRFTLIAYDWQAHRLVTRGTKQQTLEALDSLKPANVAPDPALVEAIKTGLRSLLRKTTGSRRLLVLFSDGINNSPKRNVFRGMGTRARNNKVLIHPIAYSAIDERGPLLNLGEIAKRTGGTFRWAQKKADIQTEFLNLTREINQQMVLTFEVPDRCAKRHTVQVQDGDLLSNKIELVLHGSTRKQTKGKTNEGKDKEPSLLLIVAAAFGGLVVMLGLLLLARRVLKPTSQQSKPTKPIEKNKKREKPATRPKTKRKKKKTKTRFHQQATVTAGEQGLSNVWLLGASPIVFNLRFQIPVGRSTLGAAPDNTLQLDGESIAPYHIEIICSKNELCAREIPPQRMMVNGRWTDQKTLEDGDLLQIGEIQLIIRET